MAEAPRTLTTKVTVERRAQIVLIGINRPEVHNRVDPETYSGLGKAFYRYDRDPTLRAAVLWGHGENFSGGIDVDAFQALTESVIRATLASAHVALKSAQGEAFAKLDAEYRALYATEDFKEGRRAEAECRTPVYHGR